MIGQTHVNRFGWRYSLQTTPSTTPGVAVTPGSSAEGAWAQLASAANLAHDAWGIWLWINAGNTTATQRDLLIDIGVDPAGGTSYTAKINNIIAGQASAALNGGQFYWFPLFIKAGSSVAARAQGSNTSTVRVMAVFYGRPSNPEVALAGQWAETVGTVSGNGGVSFTPGTSAAEGSWVSLGTTTRDCWFWQLGVQASINTTTALAYVIDLAWGDASNKHMIIENAPILLPGTAEQTTRPLVSPGEGWADVPAGSTLYVRASCSGTPVTGWNALAIGIGG